MRAARYRAALEQLGLTPTAAARLLGVSGPTSRRWAARPEVNVNRSAEILLRLLLAGRITPRDIGNAQSERG